MPFVLVGVALNIAFPSAFSVGGPPPWLRAVAALVLAVGVVAWAWSALLILTKVRAGELVTTGPYSLVKHPLYTSVALLALSWLGFLFGTWLGALIGIALYVEAHLRRIEAVDPALNAIVIRLDEQALAAADAADRAVASGNQSVVPRCWLSLDVPFGRRSSGWMRPDAAPDLWSLAPR